MSTLRVSTIQDTAGSNSSTPSAIANGIAKAWVNFDGTGTVAIRAQYNVSSITDNGTGDYTVNFTTALADANYSLVAQGNLSGGSTSTSPFLINTLAAGSGRIFVRNGTTGGFVDQSIVCVSIFR